MTVSHPPQTLCTSVVVTRIQYIQRLLDEAASCSGGCDNEESSGGKIKKKMLCGRLWAFPAISTVTVHTYLSPNVPKPNCLLIYTWKRLVTLNWQLFNSSGSISLIEQRFSFMFPTQRICDDIINKIIVVYIKTPCPSHQWMVKAVKLSMKSRSLCPLFAARSDVRWHSSA